MKLQRDFELILEGIRANSREDLFLGHTYLTQSRTEELAEALKGNTSVTDVNFAGQPLRKEQAAALAPALKSSRVTKLELPQAYTMDEGATLLATALQGSCLRELHLAWNGIHDEGAVALFQALPGSNVRHLGLTSNRIGDTGAEVLAECLDLEDTPLRALELGDNLIGPEGLKAIVGKLATSQLRKLGLSRINMGDAGAEILASGLKGSRVSLLNVCSNGIGAKGAAALAAILGDSALTHMLLKSNHIGEEGGQAFLQALPNSAVILLDLHGNGCSSETLNQIQAALEANETRPFVLEMYVEGDQPPWKLTFRTLGASVAAVLEWSSDQPVQELPRAVFAAMRTAGFCLPCKHLRAHNLEIVVKSSGEVLDVGDDAADMATQLGVNKERRLD